MTFIYLIKVIMNVAINPRPQYEHGGISTRSIWKASF